MDMVYWQDYQRFFNWERELRALTEWATSLWQARELDMEHHTIAIGCRDCLDGSLHVATIRESGCIKGGIRKLCNILGTTGIVGGYRGISEFLLRFRVRQILICQDNI